MALRAALRSVTELHSEIQQTIVCTDSQASLRLLQSGPAAQATPEQVLTAREQDVLALVAQGQTNKAIARVLEISPATVKVHVERIISKLGVADRTQAAVVAVRADSLMGRPHGE